MSDTAIAQRIAELDGYWESNVLACQAKITFWWLETKILIARTLCIHKAHYFDEPTVALDPAIRNNYGITLTKLRRRVFVSWLTTHYLEEAEKTFFDVWVLVG